MIAINTQNRVKKVCELLSTAVSVGSLDPATRVDVAVCSARLCLDGVKVRHDKYSARTRLCSHVIVVIADTVEGKIAGPNQTSS